jgi:hypothetical protein
LVKHGVRINSIEPDPLVTMDFTHSGPDGDQRVGTLPIVTAFASFPPGPLDALILTAGLKGVRGVPEVRPVCPLGVAVAIWLETMTSAGSLPSCKRTGVILAGGFNSHENHQDDDEVGIATAVWYAFSRRWKWVAGVAGEGDSAVPDQYDQESSDHKGTFLLDGRAVDLDSLRIGGVGGILDDGINPDSPSGSARFRTLSGLAGIGVDLLVLHESPHGGRDGQPGSAALRDLLESLPPMLVVCGHDCWDSPMVTLDNGTQILNVAGRVVVLRRQDPD